jgi:exonuclease, DNA polymerase III, epsilon subunit family
MANSYVAIDLETTGLSVKNDKIIEICAIKVINGQVTDKIQTLINPEIPIPMEITILTGITDKDVETAPYIYDVIHELIEFCNGFILLGHKIIFDYSFIKRFAVNAGLTFEKEGIDTLKIAMKLLQDVKPKNLSSLCEYYGIKIEKAHRAFGDALATHKLYEKLFFEFGKLFFNEFRAEKLVFNIKKQQKATKYQKEYLIDLIKYHKIELCVLIEELTRSEASKMIDKIIYKYGKKR